MGLKRVARVFDMCAIEEESLLARILLDNNTIIDSLILSAAHKLL